MILERQLPCSPHPNTPTVAGTDGSFPWFCLTFPHYSICVSSPQGWKHKSIFCTPQDVCSWGQEALGISWPTSHAQIKVNSPVLFLNQEGPGVCQVNTTLWVLFHIETECCPYALGCHPHPHHELHSTKLLASVVIFPFSHWVSDETEPHTSRCPQSFMGVFPSGNCDWLSGGKLNRGPLSGVTNQACPLSQSPHLLFASKRSVCFSAFCFLFSLNAWSCCSLLGRRAMISSLIFDDSQLWKSGQGKLYWDALMFRCLPSFLHPGRRRKARKCLLAFLTMIVGLQSNDAHKWKETHYSKGGTWWLMLRF